MNQEWVMWAAGICVTAILGLIAVIHSLQTRRIDSKADAEGLQSLEKRHDEISNRMNQMHEENRQAASGMESRFRQDYSIINTNIAQLTGRIDEVLRQISRRAG